MPVEYHFWYCVLGAAILVLMQQLTSTRQSTISGYTPLPVETTSTGRGVLLLEEVFVRRLDVVWLLWQSDKI